jgi:HNH endonuclease
MALAQKRQLSELIKINFFVGLIEQGRIRVDFETGKFFRVFKNSEREITKTNTKGYIQISGYIDGKEVTYVAHRLLMALLYGYEAIKGLQINQENGNKRDNKPSNLSIVTQSENIKHAYKNGLNSVNPHRDSLGRFTRPEIIPDRQEGLLF